MPLSAPDGVSVALTQYDYRAAADRMTAAGVSLEMTAEETWLDFAAIRARYVGLAAPMIDGLFLPAHRWSIGAGREGPGPIGAAGYAQLEGVPR